MKKLSFPNKILYFINSLLATLLLLSYLVPYISPENYPTIGVLSILVPILILSNFLFALYWLISLRKQCILSISILVLGWFVSTPFYKISSKDDTTLNSLSIMSYNVRMFNHWNWIDDQQIPSKILGLINKQNPDVLLVQEYYKNDSIQLNYPYKSIKTKNANDKIGLAIFSKYPILNSGSFDFKKTSNNIIFSDILYKRDTIRFYNIHLQSLQINPDEENFGQKDSEMLLKRIKSGFTKQAQQTELFLEEEQLWKGKSIIAGDFNNTSYSWVYDKISEDKKDAFIEAGSGFGKTFNYFFPLRIDFILTDESTEIHTFETFPQKFSDHFPILATVSFEED